MTLHVIISGASRGFGAALARSIVSQTPPDSALHLVLVARSLKALESVAASLYADCAPDRRKYLTVRCEAVDLSDLQNLDANLDRLLAGLGGADYARAMLFNNAASIGQLRKACDISSLQDLKANIDFNVTSSMWVSSRWAKARKGAQSRLSSTSASSAPDIIVNVSSLAAIQPFPHWAMYCAGKAANDMFHSVLAVDVEKERWLKTLNYAPGPMNTEMQREIREDENYPNEYKSAFSNMHEKGTLVSPDMSADKCIRICMENKFLSGAHVDYYDADL